MSKFMRLFMAGFVVFALWGCDDDPEPTCEGVENSCETEGALQCNTDGDAVMECEPNSDECLVWRESDSCSDAQVCEDTGDGFECVCDDECDTEGDVYCVGDVIVECIEGGDGCMIEDTQTDCDADGQTCEEGDDGARCTGCIDECDADGMERCDGDTVQLCEIGDSGCLEWTDDDVCSGGGLMCVEDGDSASCEMGCEDECELDDTECDDLDVLLCELGDSGCSEWMVADECNPEESESCEVVDGEAMCVGCEDECEVGATRCDGDVIETCERPEDACAMWAAGDDCADMDPAHSCEIVDEEATCVAPLGGDSCADPMVVASFPYVLSGEDFTADFTNTVALSDESCTERLDAVEAVFAVDLTEGQILRVQEMGGLDVVLSLVMACDGAAVCTFSEDMGELAGHSYTAEADGRVFVIVESWSAVPTTADYEIHFDLGEAEICDDMMENDLDGLTDCDDPDCFGIAPCDVAELNCRDEEDNDGDEAVDCDDSDCDEAAACLPVQGIYEIFETGETVDLIGNSITFTPDAMADHGYTFVAGDGVMEFPYEVGTGTASVEFTMDDDDFEGHAFENLPEFTFYGVTYHGVFVSSNGFLSFGSGSSDRFGTPEYFFTVPAVAAMMTDLDPTAPSSAGDPVITVDDFAERVVVTYQNIPRYHFGEAPGPNDFQIALNADGSIEIVYLNIDDDSFLVGIGAGSGTGEYPGETDFVELPTEDCTDDVDNDLDELTDCDDPDCFGVTPCDAAELNCGDDADNDDDGATDCDDDDCAADPRCIPEAECDDDTDNDLDELTDCDDPDCFGMAPCDAAELNCGDDADNDGDGATDCDDDDCVDTEECAARMGIYEQFDDGELMDIAGNAITYTPSADDAAGYTWTLTEEIAAFPYEPGMGTATAEIELGDDASAEYEFVNLAGFDFYGETYTSVFVGSNGYVTFGEGSSSTSTTLSAFFALPTIAGMRRDLHPGRTSSAGDPVVTVDDYEDRVVVSFVNVPRYYFGGDPPGPNDFQIVLNGDGTIEVHYLMLDVPSGIIGIAAGPDGAVDPDETDFVPPVVEDCTDDMDNDGDELVDCDDSDCFGVAPCDAAELNCTDGEDNDDDGAADCMDDDCVDEPACAAAMVVINEVSFNGTRAVDTHEFVELYTDEGEMDLTGYTLVHRAGADGSVVWTIDLTDQMTDADGFFVVGGALIGDADVNWADVGAPATDALGDAAGDSLGLYMGWDTDDETLVDAVCWGDAGAGTCEGAPAPAPAGYDETSIGRAVDGEDTDVNGDDFVTGWWRTPGSSNTPAQPEGYARSSALRNAADRYPRDIPDEAGIPVPIGTSFGAHPETITDAQIGVWIQHSWLGDLRVTLTSPDGTTVTLFSSAGGAGEIATIYDSVTEPDEAADAMDAFDGENGRGLWYLRVFDEAGDDVGQVVDVVLWLM